MTPVVVLVCGLVLADAPPAEAPKPADLSAYEDAQARAGRGADAQVKLALWCEAHGLRAEGLKHLARAVLSDPTNATARGLMGLVAFQGQWKRPDAVAAKVKADEALAASLAEYNARRSKTPETADAQWKLALWCEQNGLSAEAKAHLGVVTRLDPSREAAWKKLGCKKVNGRWVTDAQLAAEKAEADAQKKADRLWRPLLTRLREALGGKDRAKRDDAEAKLAEVNDPRAVPSVWAVFANAGQDQHARAVAVLSRIDAAASSRALAWLAVFDDDPEVRRAATESLKRRDPREFAGLLVALMGDTLKYEVRPVGGPGSPGALFVAGKQVNIQRVYGAPMMPAIPRPSPSATIVYDADGLPVITDTQTNTTSRQVVDTKSFTPDQFARLNPTDPALAGVVDGLRSNLPEVQRELYRSAPFLGAAKAKGLNVAMYRPMIDVVGRRTETSSTTSTTQIPIGRLMLEYEKAALSSQAQLEQDVAAIDARNDGVTRLNGRVAQVLNSVSGKTGGEGREEWERWWVDFQGYKYTPPVETPRPTLVEAVPPPYTPQGVPVTRMSSTTAPISSPETYTASAGFHHSCFGAGTLVRTLEGPKAIEAVRVGDRVLTQNVRTGALGYAPVTLLYNSPSSATFLVKASRDTITSSPFHRFWVAGRGWVMARDLKKGDSLRSLDGTTAIESVSEGPVQTVYNLGVADDHDFFAGTCAALVHDISLPDTRLTPFDAAPDLAAADSPGHGH